MSNPTLDPYRQSWDRYTAAWKVDGAPAKHAHLNTVATSCVYTDPMMKAEGHDALVDYMVQFHQQVPGGHFKTQRFMAHSGRSVAVWTMHAGDGTVVGDGISHATYTSDGQIQTMTGFFEPPPAG